MPDLDPERNARQAWSENDLSELRALIARRLPVRQIAERLGRTEYAVRTKAKQQRISLKPPEASIAPHRPR